MAYEQLAYIIDGAIAGSQLVKVEAVQPEGTTIKVYDNLVGEEGGFNLLGTGTITDNIAEISLNRQLIKAEAINAYVGDFGEKTGGAILVGDTGGIPTGWKKPVTVSVDGGDPITAEEYTTETGLVLAEVYDPQTRNMTPNFPSSGIEKLLGIGFDLNIREGIGAVVVTVQNVRNCSEGYLIQFDDDALGMTNSKTYSINAGALIRVVDANDYTRDHTRSISIEVPVEPAPDSAISNASYVNNKLGNLSGIIVVADSESALEAQVDGVFTWMDMVFKGGLRWQKDYGVPAGPGTYTVRVRVKTDTADEVNFTATLT